MIESERPQSVESAAFLPSLPSPVPPKLISDSEISIHCEECRICGMEVYSQTKVSFGDCNHAFCDECARDYLSAKLSERNVVVITCPCFNCPTELSDVHLQSYLSGEDFAKLQRFRKELILEQNPDLRWCPRAECTGYDIGGGGKRQMICSECHFAFCFYCLEAWHSARKCRAEFDRKLDVWAKNNNAKFCPRCRMRIQKNKGCDHMTCTRCHYEFCWLCGVLWTPVHLESCAVKTLRRYYPPWYICLLLLFLPVLLPFFFEIFVIVCILKYLEETDEGCFYNFLRRWWISYPILLAIGLVLTPLAATGVVLFFFAVILINWGRYVKYDSDSRLQCLARRQCLWISISVILSILLSPLVALLAVLTALLGPVVGVSLFAFKAAVAVVRCCCNRNFMRPKGATGFPVG